MRVCSWCAIEKLKARAISPSEPGFFLNVCSRTQLAPQMLPYSKIYVSVYVNNYIILALFQTPPMSNATHTGIRRGIDGQAPTFFFVSDVDHGPSLLYLFPERSNRGLILLRKLEGCLDLGRIVDDFAVELSTFLDQPLLLFVRFLQRSVQLFVLKPWFIEERY